ncbi:MAG: Gfo/Idh/MocA family oxidoreductase [Caldilinea sp.]|uniref:Gfo/Idh/MocA family protein n=1 Tax=Caldilinea sp. TaxID=2293560 RepID=UPI002C2959C8|nr:Gfo/Idh/MocA family oxidoreductase [Caldilinea sp.]HRA65489.1 Gfo/Idh/MocA family oxidoreductase [Caldilinea sp.]
MPLNLAFAGVAHIHTPNFIKRILARDDVRVTRVWDHDADRAAQRAAELGAEVVATPASLWDDGSISAVVVCSETDRHEPLVTAAAAAGKHLFVEKPLGMGRADAARMAAAIEDAGVIFQTGYFMRGQPVHQFLREQIQLGHFGKITRVRHSNAHSGSLGRWFDAGWLWMTDPVQAGVGAFGDLGTHSLDILMWLMGDVARVTATMDTAVANYGATDEFGEGLLVFDNGVVGTLAAGWVDVQNPVTALVSGTEGHAYVCEDKLYFKSRHVEGADGKTPWTALPEAWPHAFELFLDAVTGGSTEHLVTPREAAARSTVMEAMYAGAQAKTWVQI